MTVLADGRPPTMTVDEVAEYLRIGRNAAYDMVRRGVLPVLPDLGRRKLIPTIAVDRYLEAAAGAPGLAGAPSAAGSAVPAATAAPRHSGPVGGVPGGPARERPGGRRG